MELYACVCGCTTFETIRTYQYDKTDFYIDSRSKEVRVAVNGIPVAKCIECQRINVPSTSMAGVSTMDPRVAAYRELLRAVEIRNNTIANLRAGIDHTVKLLVRTRLLEEKECACAKGAEVGVETGNRGRKKSETAVS